MKWTPGNPYRIALFYRYVAISDVTVVLAWLRGLCEELGLLGRILVSTEGINGTLAGGVSCVENFVKQLNEDHRFASIDWKFTDDHGEQLPFLGLSIREVDEIISCGRAKQFIKENIQFKDDSYGGIAGTGTHLTPQQFHEAVARKDGIILDIRNEFEFDIGHFDGSTNLKTFNYAETFDVLDEILPDPRNEKYNEAESQSMTSQEPSLGHIDINEAAKSDADQKVYMYCTGGIRCEKASAYLCAKGYKNVYQLEGGIHRYLEAYPDGGLFQGKNFVFDSRVAVAPPAVVAPAATLVEECASIPRQESAEVDRVVVVGRCIDCSIHHDVYSGHIVCTVCRMPVLVCPSCVASSSTPGEYHCTRHRDLKHLYFTVLTQFNAQQLTNQLEGLRSLEQESATVLEKVRQRERIARRRAASALHNSSSPTEENSTNTIDDKNEVLSETAETLSKQRRRTIRKQIERIEQQLMNMKLNIEETDTTVNPKTRGGWGFWKS